MLFETKKNIYMTCSLFKVLFQDLCLKDEAFHIRMRKAVVAVCLPVGTIVFVSILWSAIQHGKRLVETVAGEVFMTSRLLIVC